MLLEDVTLTRRCQRFRYALNAAASSLPASSLLNSRNSSQDVGRPSRRGLIRPHHKILDLVQANMRRVQEALRVLEEFTRLEFPEASYAFGGLRFRAYTLEQTFHSKLPTVRHH